MDQAPPPADHGVLAQAAAPFAGDGDASGFSLVTHADDAFMWRLALVDSAVSSIDVKYFIWHGHETGNLLFARLLEAAQRGVKVRILIDDLNLAATVEELAGIDQLENFSFKLFNPTGSRSFT